MSNGTPSFDLGQFAKLSTEVILSLPTALEGIDPKAAIKAIDRNGEQFALHTRKFFVPAEGRQKILRPRSIIRLPQIPVNHDRNWEEAIDPAGPNTGADWDVRKVGDLYVAERKGIVPTSITLVNFGEDVSSDQVIEFGKRWGLGRIIDPRECFAVAEHFPKLHTSPGFFDQMAVVSLKDCVFQGYRRVCYVWFGGRKRECDLGWFDGGWRPRCWFGFVRNFLHFVPAPPDAGFSLFACLYQPPSMRPISNKDSESAKYFLLSRAFISQMICKKSFRISSWFAPR